MPIPGDYSDYTAYEWNSTSNQWELSGEAQGLPATMPGAEGIRILGHDPVGLPAGNYRFIGGEIIGDKIPHSFRAVEVGALENAGAKLVVDHLTIKNNYIDGDCGGAIRTENNQSGQSFEYRPEITVIESLIEGNQTHGWGGVVDNVGGVITLDHCTLIGNFNSDSGTVDNPGKGAAVSNRFNKCEVYVNGCIFYGNTATQGGGALYNVTNGSAEDKISHSYVENSYFLTGSDNILCESGEITFAGKNYFAGSVTEFERDGGTNTMRSGSSLVFINSAPMELDCTLEGGNSFYFYNSNTVDMTGTNYWEVQTLYVAPVAPVGSTKSLAQNVGEWAGSSFDNVTQVVYCGQTETLGEAKGRRSIIIEDNTLKAVAKAQSLLEMENIGIKGTTSVIGDTITFLDDNAGIQEAFNREVHMGGDKFVSGNGDTDSLSGMLFTDDHSLEMVKLTYDGTIYGGTGTINLGGTGENDFLALANGSRVYAGGQISADGEFGGSTLVTGKLTTNAGEKAARIYGGCDVRGATTNVTSGNDINTTLDIASGSTIAFYGGARLYGTNGSDYTGSVMLGGVTTTISGGGIFSGFAGNGSQGNNGNVTQGDSSLTISGGSFTNYVYAGAYSQGSTSIVAGSTYLTIQGGVFDKVVFGGCAANTNKQARSTKVTGNTNITVDATGDKTITFKSHLIAGSQSCMENGGKQILGDTTITFKGKGSKIIFDEGSYVLGGSMLDKKEGVNSVDGTRTLVFDGFEASSFSANLDETYDTVKFCNGSGVTLKGNWVSLAKVNTWEFDVSTTGVHLTWENNDAGKNNINDFAGDTINLRNWNGGLSCFMIGTETTLKGFDQANVHVFNTTGEEITTGFSIHNSDNKLWISATQA